MKNAVLFSITVVCKSSVRHPWLLWIYSLSGPYFPSVLILWLKLLQRRHEVALAGLTFPLLVLNQCYSTMTPYPQYSQLLYNIAHPLMNSPLHLVSISRVVPISCLTWNELADDFLLFHKQLFLYFITVNVFLNWHLSNFSIFFLKAPYFMSFPLVCCNKPPPPPNKNKFMLELHALNLVMYLITFRIAIRS